MDNLIQVLVIYVLLVIFVIILYEVVYGYVVWYFGDLMVWQMGCISFNFLWYIDLVGIILVLVLILLILSMFGSSFLFGWVKLVLVDFGCLCYFKCDMLWVVVVGLVVNLVMLFGWVLLFKYGVSYFDSLYGGVLQVMGQVGIVINVSFMLLNLLLIFLLDGGCIMVSLLLYCMVWCFV